MSTTLYNPALAGQIDAKLAQEAMALIEPAQHIALLAHEHPDGDCLGSALGFAYILQEMGKTCVPVCIDPAPDAFDFLPGIKTLQHTLGDERFDLVIALDAGELTRYGALYEHHRAFLDSATILNIDHHISSHGCGQVNIIDPASAATAELLILFQQQAQLPLNRDAATCLLTGIITDTASFQHSSTTARTMEVGAILLRAGAIPETIIRPIFRTQPLAQMRFRSLVINQALTACNGELIWSYANDEMLATAGATADMDDSFSAVLRDIEGVQIAVLFKSYGDGQTTRMSIRSAEPYNAAEFCGRFGGGGHARAAGATIPLPLNEAMTMVIADLKQEIQGQMDKV
jgi:bifunctional oligoribonuclease and PAP phosphatase NrnA